MIQLNIHHVTSVTNLGPDLLLGETLTIRNGALSPLEPSIDTHWSIQTVTIPKDLPRRLTMVFPDNNNCFRIQYGEVLELTVYDCNDATLKALREELQDGRTHCYPEDN